MRILIFAIVVILCAEASICVHATPWTDSDEITDQRGLMSALFSSIQIHPPGAFERYIVCVDISEPDCNDTNALKFVGASTATDPQPNEFLYHDTGPAPNMQGAFWFQDQPLGNSILASFAITRGASQGERDAGGTPAYTVRPRGDHNWAFSGTETNPSGSTAWINDLFDYVYKFNRVGGSQDAPTNYKISAESNLLGNCIRANIADWIFYLFFSFTMDLTTDPLYTDSAVWQRRSAFFFGLYRPDGKEYNYNAVQILDGAGAPIQPAYDEFISFVKSEYGNRIFFYGIKPERVGDYGPCWQ